METAHSVRWWTRTAKALTVVAILYTLSNVTGYGDDTLETLRLTGYRILIGLVLWGVAALAWVESVRRGRPRGTHGKPPESVVR